MVNQFVDLLQQVQISMEFLLLSLACAAACSTAVYVLAQRYATRCVERYNQALGHDICGESIERKTAARFFAFGIATCAALACLFPLFLAFASALAGELVFHLLLLGYVAIFFGGLYEAYYNWKMNFRELTRLVKEIEAYIDAVGR